MAVAAMMLACAPEVDTPQPDPNDPDTPTPEPQEEVYTLVADKEAIDADGKEKVTFSLVNSKGENLCESDAGMVKITNQTTGLWLGYGKYDYTSVRNGEYEFSANYRGYEAANTVKVRVENRGKYEKYRQSVVIYKVTGAWCAFCPNMTESLHEAAEEWGDQMIVVGCHGGGQDPFKLSPDVSEMLLVQYSSTAYPSCIYDNNAFVSGAKDVESVKKNIITQISKYPSTCGVCISKAEHSGTTLTVEASVASDKGGSYDVACVVLADGMEYSGGTEPSGIYNNVMMALSGSLNYYNKDKAVSIAAGGEEDFKFVFDNVPASMASKCKVVVYALVRDSRGQTITDNAAVCRVGQSMTGYMLND